MHGAASEGEKYARVLSERVDSVRALGPLLLDAGIGESESGGPV